MLTPIYTHALPLKNPGGQVTVCADVGVGSIPNVQPVLGGKLLKLLISLRVLNNASTGQKGAKDLI
jgi:hypothetical protein